MLNTPDHNSRVIQEPRSTGQREQQSPSLLIHVIPPAGWFQGFPAGFPSFERLITFLHNLIQRLLGKPEIVIAPTPTIPPTPGSPPISPQPPDAAVPPDPAIPTTRPPGTPDAPTPQPTTPGNPDSPGDTPSQPGSPAGFPARPAGAMTGSQFLAATEAMSPADRERAILREILAGNMPDFLHGLREVTVKLKLSDGKEHTAVFSTLPDYLAIGTSEDFVRIPMSPIAAQLIADKFGFILPTTRMVDEIYKQATIQLYPQPMSGGQYPNWQARMTKNEFYREHHKLVETQRQKTAHQLGQLLAGHKKDVVISNFLNNRPKKVVIYGWHDKRNKGKPIQGYGYGHENTYADYSHGIRLISPQVVVDGQPRAIGDVLKDSVLSRLLSNEGVMRDLRAIR
jgi:hypothetical protein